MVQLVRDKLDRITSLCRKHRVRELYLVGSGAGEEFRPGRSDLDFLVVFEPDVRRGFDGEYFGLLNALQVTLNADVDLIERQCVENPYVRASLERSKVPLYAAA